MKKTEKAVKNEKVAAPAPVTPQGNPAPAPVEAAPAPVEAAPVVVSQLSEQTRMEIERGRQRLAEYAQDAAMIEAIRAENAPPPPVFVERMDVVPGFTLPGASVEPGMAPMNPEKVVQPSPAKA